jgi:DNA-binding MarR family transcriptional regulator
MSFDAMIVRVSNESALSPAELLLTVVARMRELSTAFDAMDEATAGYFGVNRTDARCMDILSRHPSLGMGEMAKAMGLSTAAMTTVIDRLQEAGQVRRVPDPRDRRRVQVHITPSAQRRGLRLFQAMIAAGTNLLESYSEQDLSLIADFIQRATSLVNDQTTLIRARSRRRSRGRHV